MDTRKIDTPPPAAQPSDAAGLREVALSLAQEFWADSIAATNDSHEEEIEDTIVLLLKFRASLAPYLKGEPGDSELLARQLVELNDGDCSCDNGPPWNKCDGCEAGRLLNEFNKDARELIQQAAMRGEGDKP